MAMGQDPNRPPSEHQPLPTKLGSMGGEPLNGLPCFSVFTHTHISFGARWCFHPYPHQFWSPVVVRFSLFSPIPTSVLEPGGGPFFSVFIHTHSSRGAVVVRFSLFSPVPTSVLEPGGGLFSSVFSHTHISVGARWWSVFLCFDPYPHQFWSPAVVRFLCFRPYPHQFWSPVVVRFSLFSPIPTSVLEPGGGPFFSVFTHTHISFGARWRSVFLCFHPYPHQFWSPVMVCFSLFSPIPTSVLEPGGGPFFFVFTHTHISFGARWWSVFLCFHPYPHQFWSPVVVRFSLFSPIPTSVLEPGGGPFFSVFTHTHISFGARWWSVFLCFHPYPHQFWSPVVVRFSLFSPIPTSVLEPGGGPFFFVFPQTHISPYPHQFWSPVVVRFSLLSPIPTSVLEPGPFSCSVFLCFHPYPHQF